MFSEAFNYSLVKIIFKYIPGAIQKKSEFGGKKDIYMVKGHHIP